MARRLRILFLLTLLIGGTGAFPDVAAAPSALRVATDTSVDPDVWGALTADPDRSVAFKVATVGGEAGSLEVPLEALMRAGGLRTYQIGYGEDAAYAEGTGHAVRFLAAWPSVTRISLADQDDLTAYEGMTIQSSEGVLATGAFAGAVTAADGTTPLANMRVRAYLQTGPTSWLLADTVLTASDGTYTVAGLEGGIYRAKFEDPVGDYVPEFYNDKDSFTYATNFTVNEGETTSGIDAALAEAGHIAGTVTAVNGGDPVADIVATAWYTASGSWHAATSAVSQGDGSYDIGGLAAGSYRVRFSDAYSPPRYLDEVYDNASSLAEGSDVPVTAGATTSGIDAALGQYGSVSGTVYQPDGVTPVETIYADVYAWNAGLLTWEWVSGDTTDAVGAYEAGGLETGDYRVQFSDATGQYGTEVYNDKGSLDTGDDVHVELGYETPNIDAALALAPHAVTQGLAQGWNLISFPVSLDDPSTGAALASIDGAYDVIWAYDACASPDPEWLKYDPDDPLSSLETVDTARGYWIDMATAADLTVTGTHPISTVIELCTGWNLIGYASVTEKPVTEVLAPIEGKYNLVYGYDGSDEADPWEKYNPDAPVGNDLSTMRPWYGYWIDMTEPATLTIPGR